MRKLSIKINEEFCVDFLDLQNWVLRQKYQTKLKNGNIVERTRDIGYSATIPGALRIALDKLPSYADTQAGIIKILKEIQKTAQTINKYDDSRA